jgi:ABC-2 type transport system permease protein
MSSSGAPNLGATTTHFIRTPAVRAEGLRQTFGDVNPVTVAVDAARALTIGHGAALSPVLGTLAWLAGLLLVFVPLSVRAFRRA